MCYKIILSSAEGLVTISTLKYECNKYNNFRIIKLNLEALDYAEKWTRKMSVFLLIVIFINSNDGYCIILMWKCTAFVLLCCCPLSF